LKILIEILINIQQTCLRKQKNNFFLSRIIFHS